MSNTIASYPKDKIKILLLENIHPRGVAFLKDAGYTNITALDKALTEKELLEHLPGVKVLGIRSKTHLTPNVIEAAKEKMFAVGCFCIGTNQVALQDANKAGIAVFNSPYSNTRSVAELVIGLTIMLFRQIIGKNKAAHEGIWDKTANSSFEVRGKVMGIVGYGNIGSQVSVIAESLGMNVFYFDPAVKLPLGNAKATKSLDELLSIADVITLHVPSLPSTRNMFREDTFKKMKKGAHFINHARGEVVNVDDLAKMIKQGHLGGAAVDVFPEEPENNRLPFISPLQHCSNVILTPHIAGSTLEAQEQISLDVAHKLINFIETGSSSGSKTIPEIDIAIQNGAHRILHIHKNVPGMISKISNILFENNINILGQSLKSNQDIGYAIFDVDANLSKEAYKLLCDVSKTIKVRLLY